MISTVGISLPDNPNPRSPGPLVMVSRAIQLNELFFWINFFNSSNNFDEVKGSLRSMISAPAINLVICHSHRNGLP